MDDRTWFPRPVGSIPACAGEPLPWRRETGSLRVYPRVCGGTTDRAAFLWVVVGLSPRVRGNLGLHTQPDPANGSIPACAGEPEVAEVGV